MEAAFSNQIVIYMAIATVCLIIVIIAFFVTLNTGRQKFLAKSLELEIEKNQLQKNIINASIEAEENEKNRIAEILHDDIGVKLSACYHFLQNLEIKVSDEENMHLLKNNLKEVIQNTRDLSHQTSPLKLNIFGICDAISELCSLIEKTSALKITFENENYKEVLSKEKELVLYRILQELTNNSIKHSKADLITMKLQQTDNKVLFTFSDNGVGFDVNEKTKGLGLISLKGKTSFLNAEFTLNSSPNKGMKFNLEIPIN